VKGRKWEGEELSKTTMPPTYYKRKTSETKKTQKIAEFQNKNVTLHSHIVQENAFLIQSIHIVK